MAQLTRAAHKIEISAEQPDNNTNFITAARVRNPNLNGADSCYYILSDDSDVITEGSTNLFVQGSAERSKIVNTPADTNAEITNLQNQIDALDGSVKVVGNWDASSGTFPTAANTTPSTNPILNGYKFVASSNGTIDGVIFNTNDQITALKDNPSSTTFAGEWIKQDFTDNVISVNGKQGAVVLDADDIGETATRKWLGTGAQTIDGEKTFTSTIKAKGIEGFRPVELTSGNFTVSSDEQAKFVSLTIAGALTITVDDTSAAAFDVGGEMEVFWQADSGTNSITFATGGSQTIISKGSLLGISEIGSAAVLKYLGSNTWSLIGDLA